MVRYAFVVQGTVCPRAEGRKSRDEEIVNGVKKSTRMLHRHKKGGKTRLIKNLLIIRY